VAVAVVTEPLTLALVALEVLAVEAEAAVQTV
jgi:hypothetical protein